MELWSETIMGALLPLTPADFSDLTRSLSADLALHRNRLSSLLLSPPHFARTLAHLRSLPLHRKALLLARLLLRSLHALLPHSSPPSCHLRLRDFDAAVLLLTMCECHDPERPPLSGKPPPTDWRAGITRHVVSRMLSPAGLGAHEWAPVGPSVAAAVRCRRLLAAAGGSRDGAAAAAGAVLALPSVECEGGWECAVCKEAMAEGRDVCGLPCGHVFHWGCILKWLGRRNTCPNCRFELPTDDVFAEIERVWRAAERMCGRERVASCGGS